MRWIDSAAALLGVAAFAACLASPADGQTPEQMERIRNWNPKVGEIQKPGAIQTPSGSIQQPGQIQVPHGIQAIHVESQRCEQHLQIAADALFAFDSAELTPTASGTLADLFPELTKSGIHPVRIEGHTDSVGSAAYNQKLSEERAESVKRWLVEQGAIAPASPVKGFGKTRPIAPNTHPDGSDNPEGRQKNRRVEVIVETCAK